MKKTAKISKKAGRPALDMTPIPGQQVSPANAAKSGAEANESRSSQASMRQHVNDGRNALDITPLPGDPLKRGRDGVPMVPVPPTPKPGGGTPPAEKKK